MLCSPFITQPPILYSWIISVVGHRIESLALHCNGFTTELQRRVAIGQSAASSAVERSSGRVVEWSSGRRAGGRSAIYLHIFPDNLGGSACSSEIVQAILADRHFGGRSGMIRRAVCRIWLHFYRITCRLSIIGRKKVVYMAIGRQNHVDRTTCAPPAL